MQKLAKISRINTHPTLLVGATVYERNVTFSYMSTPRRWARIYVDKNLHTRTVAGGKPAARDSRRIKIQLIQLVGIL